MKLEVLNTKKVNGSITAPPSKSYTHRAIIMAALANGISIIKKPLMSEDIISSINAVKTLGASVDIEEKNKILKISGCFPYKPIDNIIDTKNSGTTTRIITALCGFFPGTITVTGDKSIQKRPMGPLLDSLKDLGVVCRSKYDNDCPPIIIKGPSLVGGKTSIPGNISSQFITALLMAAPLAKKDSKIIIKNQIKSKPYILITLECLKKFGITISYDDKLDNFQISGEQIYSPNNYEIPGDFSSIAFMLALAAITNSTLTINNLDMSTPQGDKQIIHILKDMGCTIEIDEVQNSITIKNSSELRGIKLNMGNIPDLFPVLCILGTFARGKTILYGAKHLRYKESDRIRAMHDELSKLNITIKENEDGVEIIGPNKIKPNTVKVYNDHRIAMALTILGVKSNNLCIPNIEITRVSYPNFINDLKKIGVKCSII
ncbi:MAG: 3-phosphoshikimate 1-carboxyvinyltransferase [Candidatus Lokiarchaeota archaeon]|nr:3-phosphoshikimate 1-carboxyvinyltransferase [Candidatus Lokiarchaeota archaeon]